MFCSKCGKENDDSAVFCNGCGAPMTAVKTTQVEELSHTTGAKIRAGAILALVGAVLSLMTVLLMETFFFNPTESLYNFYTFDNLLIYACVALIPIYGVAIWKSANIVGKIMSIVGVVVSIFACFISFLCSLFGLVNAGILCIFNILNTVAMVILLVGSLKALIGAFKVENKK